MNNQAFVPHHLNATHDDLAGNHGVGRYIFLPGSDGRAKEIAAHFTQLEIKAHPRGHHLYLGTITNHTQSIDVATVASGMGCSSMEIILHELLQLGAKRFLRVGTAGSLQPNFVKVGDIINVQASVRDESSTLDYAPITVPAIAALEFVNAIILAGRKLALNKSIHTGTVHCKSSFYAREFGYGPNARQNKHYISLLTECGVLASEMETAILFIQSQIYHHQMSQHSIKVLPSHQVLSGAILGIVSDEKFATPSEETILIHQLIALALETIKIVADKDLQQE